MAVRPTHLQKEKGPEVNLYLLREKCNDVGLSSCTRWLYFPGFYFSDSTFAVRLSLVPAAVADSCSSDLSCVFTLQPSVYDPHPMS